MKFIHRHNITGELLPPMDAGRELVPWEEQAPLASRAPVINIQFPRARGDDSESPPLMVYERRHAQRTPSVESDVIVPGLQTALTALTVAVATGAGCLLWHWHVRTVLVAFAVAVLVAWVWRVRLVDGLFWELESITGHDLNHDGKVGNPAQSFTVANPAMARAEAKREADDTEQAAQRAELLAFLHRCYTVGTAETAHGVKAGGPDRTQYLKQRDVLMALGIASWKNPERPKAGWKMSVSYARAQELIARHVL